MQPAKVSLSLSHYSSEFFKLQMNLPGMDMNLFIFFFWLSSKYECIWPIALVNARKIEFIPELNKFFPRLELCFHPILSQPITCLTNPFKLFTGLLIIGKLFLCAFEHKSVWPDWAAPLHPPTPHECKYVHSHKSLTFALSKYFDWMALSLQAATSLDPWFVCTISCWIQTGMPLQIM